jgi:hypothetical protein
MTPESPIHDSFEALRTDIRADFRATTNSIIRWNVASIIFTVVATCLIVR